MNVQAFLNNISFPKTVDELEFFADEFNMEEILTYDETEWTAPKWAVPGDIVLFFHAKTAIQKITSLETKLKKEKDAMDKEAYQRLWDSLQRARTIYKRYGGKIFALGRISGRSVYDMREGDEIFHWGSRFYAPIDRIFVLKQPVDIAEFSDFIFVSRQSAITPVVGGDFEHLKEIIMSKNEVPDYFRESRAIPLPLQRINAENWLDVTREYRRRFSLEIQFRRFYVDYFLRVLGDQKKFFSECRCRRAGSQTGFADNAVKMGGKWCFVEVKLNVHAEQRLHDQLKKYCQVEQADLHEERILEQPRIWQETVLVIDTTDCYCYDAGTDRLTALEQLDNIRTENDIRKLRENILPMLQ